MKKQINAYCSGRFSYFKRPPGPIFKFFLFSFLITVFSVNTFSQQKLHISGVVKDEKGQVTPNASITLKGAKTGVTTDANGEFSMDVPNQKSILIISSTGFEKQEIAVNGTTSFNVKLVQTTSQLNEVIVVGYGTQRKATLTGAVSSIKGSDIVKSPATNVSNSLVGRIPGLTAVQGSGEPGADGSTLRIRGVNSLGNNDVLVVVDGIAGRSLDRIDPNSIESMTVLKDASAAIYGAQAANGVILITTKRGKLGKPEITFNINEGYNQPTKIPKMANSATYATMLNEIASYAGNPAAYTPAEVTKFGNGSDLWRYPNTDWFKATLKPRSAQSSYNATISGGAENLRYFVSLGARMQDGNYYHSATKYNQYDLRTNIDGKITKNISLVFDVSGRMEDKNYPTRGAGDIFWMVMRGKPTFPAYWPDGTPGPDIEYGNNPVVISTDATGYDKDKYYTLNTNLKLNINIPWIKGLSISGTAAIDKGFDFRKKWQTPWYLYTANFALLDANGHPTLTKGKRGLDQANLNEYSRDELNKTFYGLINYDTKVGNHAIKFLAGAESRTGNSEYFSAFRKYFTSTAVDQLFAGGAAEINNSGSGTVVSRLNYFGRVNYAFKDKYLAEFVWREDGSYNFPAAHRWGFFPGISAGWVMSDENFFKNNVHFIDRFKIRGSTGKTGNDRIQLGPNGGPLEFQYLSTFGYGNVLGSPYLPFVTNGSAENQTLYETRLPNPNITWEVANQSNIGFEASLLHNKLTVEFDYFNYHRSSVLAIRNASVPASAGITLPPENIGKVKNTGFDFTVAYKNNINDFNYSVSLNGGYAKNKILFWDEAPGVPNWKKSTSFPMNTGVYYQAMGVYADQAAIDKSPHWSGARPGDIIFKDINNDGVIDANDQVRSDKSTVPTFTGGLNLNLSYKGFDLSILTQAATGAVNYIDVSSSGEIGNFLQSNADGRWTSGNTNNNKPRANNRGNEYWVGQANTYFLHKTDYIRLKNFQFGYTLPKRIIQKIGMQMFRVYVSGYNLLTYSPDYKDFDPEASSGNGTSYPLQRVVSAGLSLTF